MRTAWPAIVSGRNFIGAESGQPAFHSNAKRFRANCGDFHRRLRSGPNPNLRNIRVNDCRLRAERDRRDQQRDDRHSN